MDIVLAMKKKGRGVSYSLEGKKVSFVEFRYITMASNNGGEGGVRLVSFLICSWIIISWLIYIFRWTRIADMNVARSNFGLELVEGRIVVFGGYDGSGVTAAVEWYDKVTRRCKNVFTLVYTVPNCQLPKPELEQIMFKSCNVTRFRSLFSQYR